jgi:ATP-dependent exoDNAse (exonuclease V) beta subunit
VPPLLIFEDLFEHRFIRPQCVCAQPNRDRTDVPEEIEEERRLLYVGMTRAKDELDLIVPYRFFTYNQAKWGDRHVYASVSRFIPKSIHDAFERRHWSERPGGPDTGKPKLLSKIDIAANVGRMWRRSKDISHGAGKKPSGQLNGRRCR